MSLTTVRSIYNVVRISLYIRGQNNESSEVCSIIKPAGQMVKLNRSQTENVHKLLTIRYLHMGALGY